jgi:hypothetical protein
MLQQIWNLKNETLGVLAVYLLTPSQWSALGRQARARPKSLPNNRVARWLDGLDGLDGCFGYSGDDWEQILVNLCAVMTEEYK